MSDVISERFPPCGWACVRSDRDRIEYRPEDRRFVLAALETDEETWELRCRQRVGEAESAVPLGFVSTRDDAVRCLFECMRSVNRTMREAGSERVIDVRRLRDRLRSRRGVEAVPPDYPAEERRRDPTPMR